MSIPRHIGRCVFIERFQENLISDERRLRRAQEQDMNRRESKKTIICAQMNQNREISWELNEFLPRAPRELFDQFLAS